ncbi:MAG: cereblon family protein [Polyangiaceae bacterium]|jgi:hypothetical protein|nr:cereblon family protein [Polyangiaceae bacterium]
MEPLDPVPVQPATRALPRFALREAGQGCGAKRGERAQPRDARTRQQVPELVCVACRHAITSRDARVEVAGAHRHTFANPNGIVYCIGCFSRAPGCLSVGRLSTEFPWFAGFAWQVAVCGRCSAHLGWGFRSADRGFHGLILDRLVEEATGQRHESR